MLKCNDYFFYGGRIVKASRWDKKLKFKDYLRFFWQKLSLGYSWSEFLYMRHRERESRINWYLLQKKIKKAKKQD